MGDMYKAGFPIKIGCYGYYHYAIVSDRRKNRRPMLISLSRRSGTVAEESWDEVVQGRTVEPSLLRSNLAPEEVVRRARSQIGRGRYNFITNNCEHFVRETLGLPPRSRQLEAAASVGVSALLFALRFARGNPAIAITATVASILLSSRFSAR